MRVRCAVCGDVRRSSDQPCKCDKEDNPEHKHWTKEDELACEACNE